MYEAAIKLIKKGKAYVCDLSADEIREYRGTLKEPGKNSPYRDRSVEENLKLFEGMKNGEYPDGSKVLRAKIDLACPICRYPFGSGGKRVTTSVYLPSARSLSISCSIKFFETVASPSMDVLLFF